MRFRSWSWFVHISKEYCWRTIVCQREGNGNPLQCSCLENPVDRGAWWAAVHSVTQSWTGLKRLSMHACIREGNGNPLQYSCLENPRDRGAWWAAVYGVAQSQTRLKWLSRSRRPGVRHAKEWVLRWFWPHYGVTLLLNLFSRDPRQYKIEQAGPTVPFLNPLHRVHEDKDIFSVAKFGMVCLAAAVDWDLDLILFSHL